MKYFQMRMRDAFKSWDEMWRRQDAYGIARTMFSSSGSSEVSVWTESGELAEIWYRELLQELGVRYTESDTQHIRTWLDDVFGSSEKGGCDEQ